MMVTGVSPVVMDFGLAKQVRQADAKLTQEGSMLGTPAYMPPEQVNGELERMGPASDIYSLGVILYELLTGRLPFEGSMAAIFGKILYTEPPSPSALVPGLNPALDAICRKAMAKLAADRYPSMKAFAAALTDFLRSTPATAGAGGLVPNTVDNAAIFQTPTVAPARQPADNSDVFQLAPTAGDKAAVFQAATVAPGRQPAANSDVFQTPTVAPRERPSLPPTPREAKPPSVIRRPQGAHQTIQTADATDDEGQNKRHIGIGLAVGVACALLIIATGLWASGVIRLRTANGTLVVEVNVPNPDLYVDGQKVTVVWQNGGKKAEVGVKPGTRKVELKKDGFSAYGDEVTLEDHGRTVLVATLEPNLPDSPEEGSRAGEERDDNALKLKLCWCPTGTTRGFWMGKYEVTQSEWAGLMGSMPSQSMDKGKGDRHPIYNVSRDETIEFCRKLTDLERNAGRLPSGWAYRLPTEVQWEYACRAGTTTATAFGDQLDSTQANFNGDWPHNGAPKGPNLQKAVEVGSYRPNAWGIHDMHGNVKEFTTTPGHVRSGSWFDSGRNCCSEIFIPDPPNASASIGFRVARVPTEELKGMPKALGPVNNPQRQISTRQPAKKRAGKRIRPR